MDADAGLLINAVVSGLLIGGFYAAVSVGVAISFGMLDIVNIAHPAFILLGSYAAFIGNTVFGIDPILATVITLPAFYVLGLLAYQVYYVAFERRDDQSLRGLSFFFGLLFIAEVGLILAFGVDYRSVQAWYTTGNLNLGFIELPWRLLVPFLLGMAMVAGLQLFLSRTFIGRAIQAVAQDQQALRLMAANPAKIKRIAFGLSLRHGGARRRGADHHPADRTLDRPRIYRPHLRDLRAGRARQLPRHGDRRPDARQSSRTSRRPSSARRGRRPSRSACCSLPSR